MCSHHGPRAGLPSPSEHSPYLDAVRGLSVHQSIPVALHQESTSVMGTGTGANTGKGLTRVYFYIKKVTAFWGRVIQKSGQRIEKVNTSD